MKATSPLDFCLSILYFITTKKEREKHFFGKNRQKKAGIRPKLKALHRHASPVYFNEAFFDLIRY